jgi:hypothetical protein
MENWTLVSRRNRGGPQFYLNNRSKTLVWLGHGAKSFDPHALFAKLEEVKFPLKYIKGMKKITFKTLKKTYFGEYWDGEIWIDSRKKHRMSTLVDTFVHEVAHFLDEEYYLSHRLTAERKRKGKAVHTYAMKSDEEYFARGFERFYSLNPDKKKKLKKRNPELYKKIAALHRHHRSKSKSSSK